MKAGDLRHRITLQRAETHTDERGRRITAWRDVATVMAAMADVSQKNLYVAQAYHAEDILTFTIRYRRSIRQEQRDSWRVLHQGIHYEIVQVNALSYQGDYMAAAMPSDTGQGSVKHGSLCSGRHCRRNGEV